MNILDKIKRVCLENVVKDEIEDFKLLFIRCVNEIQHKFDVEYSKQSCGGLKLDCLGGSVKLEHLLKLDDVLLVKVKVDNGGNTMYSIIIDKDKGITFKYMKKLKDVWYIDSSLNKDDLQNVNKQLKNMIDELRGSV